MTVERYSAAISSEIQRMAREDQRARTAGDAAVTAAIDQKNRMRLLEIVRQIGWPSKTKVGGDASHSAWLLVQHADDEPSFQRSCLNLMKAAPSDEVEPEDIAYLEDRIAINEDRPQLYGTQWKVDQDGIYVPEDILDPDHIDQHRAAMGMDPFAEFSEAMQAMYQDWLAKKAKERKPHNGFG